MAELILEPYAVIQYWKVPGEIVPWDVILAEYLQALAYRCQQEAGNFLGHIKALALIDEEHYLRLSVVDPHRPANLEGHIPNTQNKLELTLNVVVYKLEHKLLGRITEAVAVEVASQWNGEVSIQMTHQH